MAEIGVKVQTVKIVLKNPSKIIGIIVVALFWIFIVTVVGFSRWAFGGALIIDLIAGGAALIGLAAIVKKISGEEVTMPVEEAARWIEDGAPADVQEWRRGNA